MIKYKEKFENEMKDKKHHYNPLDSASFRQNQLAATLASNVKYKKDIQNMHDPVSDLPNLLFLDHVLKASKMLSGVSGSSNGNCRSLVAPRSQYACSIHMLTCFLRGPVPHSSRIN
ncbi:hypothetical protein P7K49_014775 [Saguinus oedipus]|uniref:Uncharacterized protein n=1 Tax=Saguinus oedipus TaxID=9490 RepID=A0ABQ9V7Y8_SAGOE|nr:hypothetical protein P7K49_014775 [Saguinus oedipus]